MHADAQPCITVRSTARHRSTSAAPSQHPACVKRHHGATPGARNPARLTAFAVRRHAPDGPGLRSPEPKVAGSSPISRSEGSPVSQLFDAAGEHLMTCCAITPNRSRRRSPSGWSKRARRSCGSSSETGTAAAQGRIEGTLRLLFGDNSPDDLPLDLQAQICDQYERERSNGNGKGNGAS